MKSIIFWDVTSPADLLVLAEIISLTLKMEAICSSETSVETQQTTRRHIPEDDTLHSWNMPGGTEENKENLTVVGVPVEI
jgi:hypothetical protein